MNRGVKSNHPVEGLPITPIAQISQIIVIARGIHQAAKVRVKVSILV